MRRRTAGATILCLLTLAAPRPGAAVQCLAPPVEHVVAPAATDPAIGTPTASHYAYVTPGARARQQLLVFFPGSCAPAVFYRGFLREAANDGYHAVGLTYPNCPEVNATCNAQVPIDPDCQEKMRLERLDGTDASPLIVVSPADAIVNRLAKLLGHLEVQHPGEGWGAFLDGGAPRWAAIVVAGHSQGAGHAANIGRLFGVARVILFDWTELVPGVGAAPWLSKPKVTSPDRFYGLFHEGSFAFAIPPGWDALGVPAGVVDTDDATEPFAHAHRLSTSVLDQAGVGNTATLHSAVVVDGITPIRADGTPVLSTVWRHLLGTIPSEVVPVPASTLLLKDGSARGRPAARKLQLAIDTRKQPDAHRVRSPAPGSDGDPMLGGATLHVFNAAAGGEVASFVLPAAGWSRLGSATSPRGFRYKDGSAAAPIRKLVVQDDRITAVGGRDAFCFTLDEAQQGRIGVRLELGAGVAWCADVPAKAQGNPPTTANTDRVDIFRGAADAPPAACPMVPRAPVP